MNPPQQPAIEDLLLHANWLRGLAHSLVADPNTADDVLQRTWAAVIKNPPTSSPRGWLSRVLRNFIAEHFRRAEARSRYEEQVEAPVASPAAYTFAERADIQNQLAEALLSIAEPYRETVVKRYYQELSSADIAREANIPESTVRGRLKRGLEMLREELDRRNNGDRSEWVGCIVGIYGEPSRTGAGAGTGVLGISLFAKLSLSALFVGTVGVGLYWLNTSGPTEKDLVARDELPDLRTDGQPATLPGAGLEENRAVHMETSRDVVAPPTLPDETAAPPTELEQAQEKTFTVAVRAVDTAGSPVADARVCVLVSADELEERTTTDRNGFAQVTCTESEFDGFGYSRVKGHVGIRIVAPGRVASALHHFTPEAAERETTTFTLNQNPATIRGRVTDTRDNPIAGARISINKHGTYQMGERSPGHRAARAPIVTYSAVDGTFEVEHLLVDTSILNVSAPGFVIKKQIETPREVGVHDCVVRLSRGGTVVGTARNSLGGVVAGASLWFEPTVGGTEACDTHERGFVDRMLGYSTTAVSGLDGSFRLDGIPEGPGWAWIQHPTRPELLADLEFECAEGEELAWDPILAPHPAFEVFVFDADGQPLADHSIGMTDADPIAREFLWKRVEHTDVEGRVRLFDLPETTFTVRVGKPNMLGGLAIRNDVKLSDSPLHIRLEPPVQDGRFTGRIISKDGKPLGSAKVSYLDPGMRQHYRDSLDVGAGTFDSEIPPGFYTITVASPEYGVVHLGEHELEPGTHVELNTVFLEELGFVRIMNRWEEAEGVTYRIYCLVSPGTEFERRFYLAEGSSAPEPLYHFLPGTYGMEIKRGDDVLSKHLGNLTSGGEIRFDARPDGDTFVEIQVADDARTGEASRANVVIKDAEGFIAVEEEWDLVGTRGPRFVQLPEGTYVVHVELSNGMSGESEEFELHRVGIEYPIVVPIDAFQ